MTQNQVTQQRKPNLLITTDEILNAILQYLSSRPYSDVAHLIDALKQSTPYTPPVNKPEAGYDEGSLKESPKTIPQMEVVDAEEVNNKEN